MVNAHVTPFSSFPAQEAAPRRGTTTKRWLSFYQKLFIIIYFWTWQCREPFTFTYLSNFREPRSVQSTNPHWQTPVLFTNGRMGRKEINNKPGVFLLPPRTLVSLLRHKKHSAGWISVTKLSQGAALQQPGRDKAAYPQGRSSAAASAAGSLLPFTGCEFHLCEKITLILWA